MMLLTAITTSKGAPPATAGDVYWYIGLAIGFAIVVVVVVIAASILASAARIDAQAREGIDAMDEARVNTLPIWEVQTTNSLLTTIWKTAEAARESLEESARASAQATRLEPRR